MVVYGLTKIVYPVIRNEFSTQCPDHVLNEIRMGISEQQNAKYCKGSICSGKDVDKSRKDRMYLTKDQQRQLSQTSEFITSKIILYNVCYELTHTHVLLLFEYCALYRVKW